MRAATCHPEERLMGKGLCSKCYHAKHKTKTPTCGHPEKAHAAKGLCTTCYERMRSKIPERQERVRKYRKNYTTKNRIKWNLKFFYGLTPLDVEKLLEIQNYSCAICKELLKPRRTVDHSHQCCASTRSCGKCVRGILCVRCNTFLGVIENNVGILDSVQNYLTNPPVNKIQKKGEQ